MAEFSNTRTGKIARLPREIREQVNRRLDDGEKAPIILSWLNSLPEVKQTLAVHFESRSINAVNITEWRQGGFQDWRKEKTAGKLTLEQRTIRARELEKIAWQLRQQSI